jgi:hypothetical protein
VVSEESCRRLVDSRHATRLCDVVAFIVAVLACAWLPSDYAKLVLIGLGLAYMAASFWFSQAR